MPWILSTTRPSGRFEPIDDNDDDSVLNAFACIGEIRAFTICCPACGATHEIASDVARPRAFDRQRQVFRCTRCPFRAEVRVTVDVGFAHERGGVGDQ
jgi:hypothetical protein